MSKFDDIKIPDNIDEVTKNAIRRGKTKKHRHRRMNKVASILARMGRNFCWVSSYSKGFT